MLYFGLLHNFRNRPEVFDLQTILVATVSGRRRQGFSPANA
jgi:hypothetical protein